MNPTAEDRLSLVMFVLVIMLVLVLAACVANSRARRQKRIRELDAMMKQPPADRPRHHRAFRPGELDDL